MRSLRISSPPKEALRDRTGPQPEPAVEAAHAKSVEAKPPAQSSAPPSSAASSPKAEPPTKQWSHAGHSEDRTPASDTGTAGPSSGAGIAAPPSVRRLARELGVELSHVKGTGGRITAEDVKAYVRERTRRAGSPSGKDGQARGNVFSTMYGNERREAIPSLRRKIAATVTQAWTTITRPSIPGRRHHRSPRPAQALRAAVQGERRDVDLDQPLSQGGDARAQTVSSIQCVARSDQRRSDLQGVLQHRCGGGDPGRIDRAGDPSRRSERSAADLLELADLAERTRARTVKLEELRGATFSVSNMGGLGAGPFRLSSIRRRSPSWDVARAAGSRSIATANSCRA